MSSKRKFNGSDDESEKKKSRKIIRFDEESEKKNSRKIISIPSRLHISNDLFVDDNAICLRLYELDSERLLENLHFTVITDPSDPKFVRIEDLGMQMLRESALFRSFRDISNDIEKVRLTASTRDETLVNNFVDKVMESQPGRLLVSLGSRLWPQYDVKALISRLWFQPFGSNFDCLFSHFFIGKPVDDFYYTGLHSGIPIALLERRKNNLCQLPHCRQKGWRR